MSKYRLSYLENGGYKDIDLSKLYCLRFKRTKVTDIRTIDELTMSFKNYEDFINFLKRNNIVDNTNINLEITIDKKIKHNGQVYNKPIYNSDKLLFGNDDELYHPSYILKIIRKHIFDSDFMYKLAKNYEEKYSNAYNRITGSSSILGIITAIKVFTIKKSNRDLDSFDFDEIDEYQDAVNNLLYLELFKSDIVKKDDKIKVKRKKDTNGDYIKNYRGLHDFVNLIKELEPNIVKNKNEDEVQEEFLTMKDFRKVNEELVYNHHFDDSKYFDGINDFISDFESRQEMFRDLQRGSRKYILKKGDAKI